MLNILELNYLNEDELVSSLYGHLIAEDAIWLQSLYGALSVEEMKTLAYVATNENNVYKSMTYKIFSMVR